MNKKFYRLNRANLIASLPYEKCMVVLSSGYEINRSADENYEFQVNNNFYYLFQCFKLICHVSLFELRMVLAYTITFLYYLYFEQLNNRHSVMIYN